MPDFVKRYSPTILNTGRDILNRCYQALIEPVEEILNEKENLIVIPHKVLYHLPYSTLFDGKKYLIEKHCVSYIPALQWLEEDMVVNREIQPDGAVFGYGGETLGKIDKEIEYIRALFPDSRVYSGEKATKDCFFENSDKSSFLHIACHGKFRQDNPFLSGFLLSDGWITYQDIFHMNLDAGLVTLSACETGRCEVFQGEEIMGLVRSFLASKIPSIVSSLFKVNDDVTCRLMKSFYSNLKDGFSVSKSLQLAQIKIMKELESPYYWGGFQVFGNLYRD